MRKRTRGYKQFFAGLLVASSLCIGVANQPQALNGIIAIVNDQLITRADFQKALDQAAQPYYQAHVPLPDLKEFRQKTLNALINRTLILQVATQNHVTVSDQEVSAAMARLAAQNHISVDVLKQHIVHDSGMSLATFEKQLREQLLLTKVQMQAAGNCFKKW